VKVEKMGNLWHFFGLPDPEAPSAPITRRRTPTKAAEEETGQQLTLLDQPLTTTTEGIEIPEPVRAKPTVPKDWAGPLTPDGEAFHDLSNYESSNDEHPERALRYVSPDHMNRLPLREIGTRINQGDTIIVDLRKFIHMETQSNACRRQLKALGDEMGIAVFALDTEDKILLLPGNDVTVDVSKNELGLVPLLF